MKAKSKGFFWGLAFILAAVLIILSSIDIVHIGVSTLVFTIIFAAIFIGSLTDVKFTGMLFAASHLLVVYRDFINLPDGLSSWTLIIASVFLGIGLDIIFSRPRKALKEKKKARKMNKHGFSWDSDNGFSFSKDGNNKTVIFDTTAHDSEEADEEGTSNSKNAFSNGTSTMAGKRINIENSFGEKTKYVTSDDFCEANIENGFGTLNVFFDNVTMKGTQAVINVDNGFGKTNVYLPSSWKLSLDDDAGFGKIKVHGSPCLDADAPIVFVNASTGFGDINLYFN